LLDSVVKERWVDSFVSTEARILQRLVYLSSGYFQKFSKFPYPLQPLARRSTLALLVSGRRILQRYHCVSNSFSSPLSINRIDAASSLTFTSKPLQLIELQGFFVSVCAGSGANYREIKSPVNR
jgi:hypothetical protein